MKRIIPFLLLAFVAVACERDGPTVPVHGPQFKVDCVERPDHPKCTGGGGGPDVQYEFVYPQSLGDLNNSECWFNPEWDPDYRDTFYCDPVSGDPSFWLRVLGDGQPVQSGTVIFTRCEDADGNPAELAACCCRRPGKPNKDIRSVEYVIPVTTVDGTSGWFDASVALTNWSVINDHRTVEVAGMKWAYNADGKGSGDLASSPTWNNFWPYPPPWQ